ncbi:MAG: hypothetical protein AABY22_30220 [Nanoarchaeota archaeon]
MTKEQTTAYVFSQSVCALIDAFGMNALNNDRMHRGQSIAYTDAAYFELIERYGIGHNNVVDVFNKVP